MRALPLGLLLVLALPSCGEKAPPVYGPVIVLHPPAPVSHVRARVPAVAAKSQSDLREPAVLPTLPAGTPDLVTSSGSVLSNLRSARQLAAAYVAAPGATTEGIQRVRVLQLAAERAVFLMQHHHPPRQADADHAAAAVAELLDLVR